MGETLKSGQPPGNCELKSNLFYKKAKKCWPLVRKKRGGDEKRPSLSLFAPAVVLRLVVVPLNGVSGGAFMLLCKASELEEQGPAVMYIRKLSDSCTLSVAHLDPFWPQVSL